jgi:hypothetical protein
MANSPAIANLIREDKFKQLQASLFGKEGDDPDSTDFDSYYPLSDGPPGPDLNPSLVPTRPGAPDKNSSVALDEPLPEKNDDDADGNLKRTCEGGFCLLSLEQAENYREPAEWLTLVLIESKTIC